MVPVYRGLLNSSASRAGALKMLIYSGDDDAVFAGFDKCLVLSMGHSAWRGDTGYTLWSEEASASGNILVQDLPKSATDPNAAFEMVVELAGISIGIGVGEDVPNAATRAIRSRASNRPILFRRWGAVSREARSRSSCSLVEEPNPAHDLETLPETVL